MFTIALVCQKGGAGKTTLAVHLGIEAQRNGIKTLVMDLDGQASATKILDRRGEEPPDVIPEHAAHLSDALARAQALGYGLVILDTAPHADQAALLAARAADLVLVPMRPSIVDIDAVQTTMDICSLARCKRLLFVLNAISPQGREAQEAREIIVSRGAMAAKTTIGDRKAFRASFNAGRGAQEIEPRGKAAIEISALFAELNRPTIKHYNNTTRRTVGA